ncbi:hypothetical protein L211DRAFT_827928 [Terfezia boudieri ATCC MYA-4762]|uniref:FHA domain-containing protein n=1 Tax=Terfezia boudieri ATCC MYA-4762 TaxID=1051890 RepID=A0A3N4LFH0_9PEZI|nr:hypothetical protein L211DRAFT_827928 [Terfezia boudieri ATCC MYA-4762]
MWILDCEGDAISGRKLWLKPGSEYVVGRSVNGLVNLAIPHKSVSRLHLKIKVGEVPKGNGFKVLGRSSITLEGQKTMYGTQIDGEALGVGETKVLDGTEHTLKLANYDKLFRIKWQPIIFSFSLSTKEKKDKKVMAQRQSKVEKYDMKTLEAFVPTTTHVVASKRNTAIGLQALINGRYLVTEDYLNAVARACQPPEDEKSLLEDDFEKNWPDPMDFVPPPGNEPIPREKEYFEPKPERQTIFEGWTFVFCEKLQYETFLGPITDGGGKLERFEIIPGETTARKLVDFVEKRDHGNSAIVRFRGKGDTEDLYSQLSIEVSEILNIRMVEQNEFLDIILTVDTSSLRRQLEEEPTSAAPPSTAATQAGVNVGLMRPPPLPKKVSLNSGNGDVTMDDVSESVPPAKPEASQAPRGRRAGRPLTQFKKFKMDDLFSMPGDPLPPPASSQLLPPSSIGETQYDSVTHVTRTAVHDDHSALIAGTQDIAYATQGQTQGGMLRTVISQSLRKRSVEPDEEDEPDLMNKLFPGAAAMKRRKIQEEEDRAEHPEEGVVITESTPTESAKIEAETQGKKQQAKGKKWKPENPILVAAREVKEEEEKKKREEEDNKGDLDEEAILNLRSLGVVEVMEIQPRSVVMRVNAYGEDSDRWDPRWNGRSNFKKFRKRLPTGMQDGSEMMSVRGNVIIPLVEHKPGSGSVFAHGFPDESQSQKKDASEPEPGDEELGELTALAFSSRKSRIQASASQAHVSQGESLSSQTLSAGSNNTMHGDAMASRKVGTANKRPLSQNATPKGPVEKRAKKFLLKKDDSESSDEDGLRFTFRKRGR